MKKILSLIAILLAAFSSQAQFSVSKLNGPIINDGDVYTFDGTSAAIAEFKFKVTNTSSTDDINVKIKVEEITNADGSDFQLCFGDLCFFSITEGNSYPPNFALTLGPGESNGNFDHFWNTNTGNGENFPIDYRLKFYQLNDAGVEIGNSISITYRYQPNLSSSEFETLKNKGIVLNSTIVTSSLNFNTTIDASVTLTDINGKIISKNHFLSGENTIDFSSLKSAIYFAQFENKDGKIGTIKVLKK